MIVAFVTRIAEGHYAIRRAPGVNSVDDNGGDLGFETSTSAAQRKAELSIFGGRALTWIRSDLPGNIQSWRGERNP